MSSVTVVSNRINVERNERSAMKKAARMIGGSVEGHAKELCPVDTGLLRNSITFAVGGEGARGSVYYDNAMETMGEYAGEAPKDSDGQVTVYVGTNVQYAPYQELGAPSINLPAKPYLRPAFENNMDEFQQIIKLCFENM